jgi:GT2 family glycosyltransferase
VPDAPAVSVVIPTYNRQAQLAQALDGLAHQDPVDGGFEVIVVSDGSTDGTDDYLASDEVPVPVRALRQPNSGPAAARNRGVEAATAELVVFIDDDVVPERDFLAAHVRSHRRPAGAADDLVVVGPMNTPDGYHLSPWVQWEQDMLEKQYDAMQRGEYSATARQFYTGNASIARRHLEAAGGFDPAFRRAEDVELAYRLAQRGVRFTFEPAAAVVHYAARSYGAWLKAAYSYGRNDVVFARDRGQPWLLDSISAEFHERHRLVRMVTTWCVPHPRLAKASSAVLSLTARAASHLPHRWGLDRVSGAALSAVYNLAYYRGMADELGSGRQLIERFDAASAA